MLAPSCFHQFADYPAVLPYKRSEDLFISNGRPELEPEARTVRGTFVKGLNENDVRLLDLFEGDVRISLRSPSHILIFAIRSIPARKSLCTLSDLWCHSPRPRYPQRPVRRTQKRLRPRTSYRWKLPNCPPLIPSPQQSRPRLTYMLAHCKTSARTSGYTKTSYGRMRGSGLETVRRRKITRKWTIVGR